jgi:hypothetical protein
MLQAMEKLRKEAKAKADVKHLNGKKHLKLIRNRVVVRVEG